MFDYKAAIKAAKEVHKARLKNIELAKELSEKLQLPSNWEESIFAGMYDIDCGYSNKTTAQMKIVQFRAICDQIESVLGCTLHKRADSRILQAVGSHKELTFRVNCLDTSACTITYEEVTKTEKVAHIAPECLAAAGISRRPTKDAH